jgi:hypothetical protein
MNIFRILLAWNLALLLCGCASTPHPSSTPHLSTDGVVVGRTSEQLTGSEEQRARFLWDHFASKPEEMRFESETTCSWQNKYAIFAKALVEKARACGYEADSLSRVLEIIRWEADRPYGHLAFLPVGAYSGSFDGEPIWIVVVKWEAPSPGSPLAHVRVYAFTQKYLMQVGFVTCD